MQAEGYAPTLSGPIRTGTHDARIRLADGGVVSGRVVDDATNQIVPGARIELALEGLDTPPIVVTADGAGAFTFPGVAPGRYTIEVFSEGYVLPDAPAPIQVSDQPLTNLELRLIGDAVIRGVMYVAETGEPLAGAELYARRGAPNPLARSAVTEEDGAFEFAGLSSGTYTLTPGRLPGFSLHNRIGPDMTVQLQAGEVVEDVAVAVTQGLTALGRVLDAQRNPVAGADVRGRGEGWQDQQTSDAEGRFTLANLQPGAAIHVSASWGSQWSGIQGPFTVSETGLTDIELVLSESQDGLLAGVVVDAEDNPLQASLAAWPAGGPIVAFPPADTSDAEGRFVMPQVAAGEYRITAKPGGGEQMEVGHVTLEAGEQRRDLRLVYPSVPNLAIAGRVVLPDGTGVATVVRVARQEGVAIMPLDSSRSGSDGAFRFENLVPGVYALIVGDAPGVQGALIRDVAAGTHDLYIELETALRLEGYVLDATGAPVAEYDLAIEELTPLPGGSSLQRLGVQRISNPQGYFGFDANQGAYAITVQVEGRDPQRIEVEIMSSSEPGPLEIVLP